MRKVGRMLCRCITQIILILNYRHSQIIKVCFRTHGRVSTIEMPYKFSKANDLVDLENKRVISLLSYSNTDMFILGIKDMKYILVLCNC